MISSSSLVLFTRLMASLACLRLAGNKLFHALVHAVSILCSSFQHQPGMVLLNPGLAVDEQVVDLDAIIVVIVRQVA